MRTGLAILLLLVPLARAQMDLGSAFYVASLSVPAVAGGAGPTNTLAWYIGDTATTQGSSNAVTSWTDNGANGWHLTNKVAAAMPLRTNTLNGHQVLSFLAQTNYLMSQLFTNGAVSECWIVSSNLNAIAFGGTAPFIAQYSGTFIQRIVGASAGAGIFRWDLNAGVTLAGPNTFGSGSVNWRIWMIAWAGANTVAYTNNVLYNAGDSGGATRSSVQVGYVGTATSGQIATDYAELIFYNGTNTGANRLFIYQYLTNKYGSAPFK